ncbi:hypothetical protein J6590_108211 [Homalodisca vitripennis]|nr:hypothetical protein J6590_108211 [Homalodisca vitripennis]
MTFSSFGTSCQPLFKELKILSLPNLYILKTLLIVQSNFESLSSDNFDHNYNTRFKANFQYPIHRLRLVEKTPIYTAKKLYNKLPQKYKHLINSKTFKSKLTDFLLEKNYYSVDEYLMDPEF